MDVVWHQENEGMLTGRVIHRSQPRHYLVAEALPEGGWDWTTWGAARGTRAVHGSAATREGAMRAAEHGCYLVGHPGPAAGLPFAEPLPISAMPDAERAGQPA